MANPWEEMNKLPKAELLIANLLIEYIGYDCFQKAVKQVQPQYVSCIIQINADDEWVSDSPAKSIEVQQEIMKERAFYVAFLEKLNGLS